MDRIRKRLTYANVMSSIAVFLVLGGATAVAAKIGSNRLKANSVGTVKIKANAVTTRKIKKLAVTTNKIKDEAVTTAKLDDDAVTAPKLGDDAATGAKVKESTLSTVPSATTAENVNGVVIGKFDERSAGGTAEKTVFDNGHFQLTFICDGAGEITVRAYTLSDHASLQSFGGGGITSDSDFNVAENPLLLSEADEQRDVVYTDESGNVAHLSYLVEELRTSGPKCILAGFAEAQ